MDERCPVRAWELALLVLCLAGLSWFSLDQVATAAQPPAEHSGLFILESLLRWRGGLPTPAGVLEVNGPVTGAYPPLAYAVSRALYPALGASTPVAVGSMLLFLPALLAGSWWIGRELGGRGGGALTLLAVAGSPVLVFHLQGYYLEVGLTATVAAAFALLLASRGGLRPAPTLALGLVLGLGMLSKWSFPFFLGPAMLWPLGLAWREAGRARWLVGASLACLALSLWLLRSVAGGPSQGFSWAWVGALDAWILLAGAAGQTWKKQGWGAGVGLAFSLALAFLVCGWWYFECVPVVLAKAQGDLRQSFPAQRNLEYLVGVLAGCCWLAPAWFSLGTLVGLGRRELRIPTLAALGGIALPLAFYTFSGAPAGARYLMPATVLFLAVCFGWLGRVRWVASGLAPVLLALGLFQSGAMAWADAPTPWWNRVVLANLPAWARAPVVPLPGFSGPPPLEAATWRILKELGERGEREIATAELPGVLLPPPDAFPMQAAYQGYLLAVQPSRDLSSALRSAPRLLLVLGGRGPQGRDPRPWIQGYRVLDFWAAPEWGYWYLYAREEGSAGAR